jgi:hypothetical protein
MSAELLAQECDVLIFEIADQTFAADPLDVRRVGRPTSDLPVVELRPPLRFERVLVVDTPEGPKQIPVDRILGLRRVRIDHLRPTSPLLEAMLTSTPVRLVGALIEEERSAGPSKPARPGEITPPTDAARAAKGPLLLLDLRAMTETREHREEGRNGKDSHG